MKKKILSLLLTVTCIVSLSVGLAGCGKSDTTTPADGSQDVTSTADGSSSVQNKDSSDGKESGKSEENGAELTDTDSDSQSSESGTESASGETDEMQDQTASGEEERAQSTTLPVVVEGESEDMPVSLYQGEGYSIYIPEEGMEVDSSQTGDEGLVAEWKNDADDSSLQIIKYSDLTAEDAVEEFQAELSDYTFEFSDGVYQGKSADGSAYKEFVVYDNEEAAYVVTWDFSSSSKEGFGERLAQIAETFRTE